MNDSIIIKSNDLIQKSNYQLRYHQMRVLLYAISQIKRGDNVDQEYSISIKDAGDILGLDVESGGIYYKIIKETFLELTQREWGITPYGSLATISWISDVEIFPGEGMISFRFHAKMQPYLFDMKERYTQYNLEDALAMESSTSLRLFELVSRLNRINPL